MGNTDWNSILIGKSAEESYNQFFNELKYWFDVYIPERKKKAYNNNKYPIFDSDEVKRIRNSLDAIDTIFKVTRSNGAYILYKKCKEILRQKIEFGKKQHYLGLIQESDNKIKTVWNIIKKAVTKPVNATNANLSADELNDFFANVGEKINTSLGSQTSDKAMQLLEKVCQKQI
ncbi:hypothetical protein HHI36_010160 [Cryptolaemus montrouzieri]|uniref:Uncharacterized protein n=1 Tax=Cryptolaemus montrouzieri TaxID=559131 RepID=A0ABD2MHZ2_9CUCU